MNTIKKDHTKGSAAFERANYFEIPEEVSVYSWSPAPEGTPNAKSTQVHAHFGTPPGNVMVVRFKGPAGLDATIDALTDHRRDVWGPRVPVTGEEKVLDAARKYKAASSAYHKAEQDAGGDEVTLARLERLGIAARDAEAALLDAIVYLPAGSK